MTHTPDREFASFIMLAVGLHLLFFVVVRSKASDAAGVYPAPPATRYLAKSGKVLPNAYGSEVRTVKSPVVFSFPSGVGFSRELMKQDVRTRLTFSQQKKTEQFLEIDPFSDLSAQRFRAENFMLSSSDRVAPGLPAGTAVIDSKGPSARRVTIAPELRNRLVGGVVLPAALNQETAMPWEVRASMSVSKAGAVQHVFLNDPLESVPMNQEVLQLLYNLRFSPGDSIEGSIEIYSAEAPVSDG
ncbi:MAG: hypothetical protein KJN98_00005, partial [Pontiella sp.]|nr:hypothetical protein [Pontiella sp.]